MPDIFRHAWFLFIAIQCANAAVWWQRAKPHISANPDLEAGYRRMIKAWVMYGSLPWLVMGIGIVSGAVRSVTDFFNPENGPFVVAFYLTVVVLWIATAYWLFLKNGAEELIRHPGLLNVPVSRPSAVKAYFLLCLAGGFIGLSMMIFGIIHIR